MAVDFFIRTEDIPENRLLNYFVPSSRDREITKALRARDPVILVGSRGTGKSFLLKVAQAEMVGRFHLDRVLPVYVSFQKSSLLNTSDPNQFRNWMIAKICSRVYRQLERQGLITTASSTVLRLTRRPPAGSRVPGIARLEKIVDEYERSVTSVDASALLSVDQIRDVFDDICEQCEFSRISLMFDEAAHVFRPSQQRAFFTLFRDLRSAHISCNAAVYPGLTSYGDTFDPSHDGTLLELVRPVEESDYAECMREMVLRQAKEELRRAIEVNGANFKALALAVSGNPRLLLKTVQQAPKLHLKEVEAVLKSFYRNDIWRDHSALAERYKGHRQLVDWSREFIERHVLEDTIKKNADRVQAGREESTCFFWVERDTPEVVHHALRLLAYTGIVVKRDDGVVATRRATGSRYAVNLGCLAAMSSNPVSALDQIASSLSIKRFTEYGKTFPAFRALVSSVGDFSEVDTSAALQEQLGSPVTRIDLTDLQKRALKHLDIRTIRQALQRPESDFLVVPQVGKARAHRLRNAVVSSVLEFLSG